MPLHPARFPRRSPGTPNDLALVPQDPPIRAVDVELESPAIARGDDEDLLGTGLHNLIGSRDALVDDSGVRSQTDPCMAERHELYAHSPVCCHRKARRRRRQCGLRGGLNRSPVSRHRRGRGGRRSRSCAEAQPNIAPQRDQHKEGDQPQQHPHHPTRGIGPYGSPLVLNRWRRRRPVRSPVRLSAATSAPRGAGCRPVTG